MPRHWPYKFHRKLRQSLLSLGLVLAWTCLIATSSSVFARATEVSPTPVPPTQVWLINTRCAPGCGDLEAGLLRITYARLDESCGCCHWQTSDAAAFEASGVPGVPTTVLVHGYGSDDEWAVRHGFELLRLMRQHACGRPFRLVVWSWPAERTEGRPRPDVQMKVCRADVEAYYLAHLLPKLPKSTPLSMDGYSLGARTVTGALQLLAGGSVAGRNLPPQILAAWNQGGPRPIRLMLVAAAVDADWLEPGSPNGLAPLAAERILVVVNSCDRALNFYARIYGRGGPEALGFVGPTGPAGPAGGKLEVINVCCEVGRKHDFDRYHEAGAFFQRLGWYTFLCDDSATAAKPAEQPAGR